MADSTVHLSTDVLVIGAGGAGMSAALAAAERGLRVLLVDRSLIGRGGATVMAQMTVAAALGEEVPDHWEHHLADTLAAGRGLCDETLAGLLCEQGPAAIRQLDSWQVGWARHADGRIRAAQAPGHDRPRCVYVDFLSTGPAVSRTLRTRVQRQSQITRIGDLYVTDLSIGDGEACGAIGFSVADGREVAIAAGAVVLATGGLTRLYRRNSASANMGGDGHALALRAGAELMDMEFVQFFPIGHLAPRLVGMDPIMWDPFRYKLGGRLLNAEMREFMDDYGAPEGARYVVTRDKATYAILKEVQAGRGSPAGGAYLSFQHIPESALREAFGPVIDRLAKNGIDLKTMPVEVAPIAHYHMGGVRADATMETRVPNLFAAGEVVAGANGANRLSGNAITEALVFGRRAGEAAAARVIRNGVRRPPQARGPHADILRAGSGSAATNPASLIARLQDVMTDLVGPFRTRDGLAQALREIAELKADAGELPPERAGPFPLIRIDWFDLRAMLLAAEAIAQAALARGESRGAHQREDHPGLDPGWTVRQGITLRDGALALSRIPMPGGRAAEVA
ncbi:MAG: FAD-binding protein [Xanthobacteraceae bacterium]|nr:FAD-binding protein [Xanthobacteraceae bacterium]